ncbi:MAG: potassium channel family protein, partial [Nitrospiraceae bacterium]
KATPPVLSRVLFTPADLSPGRTILVRLSLVLVLLCSVMFIMWLDRDGLQDHADGQVSLSDIVYFSMVTITTVGYGDIVPVSPRARLIDALVVTPIRIFIWFLFLGTAYQLIIRQYMEGYRMAKLQAKLNGHVILCGFGNTGLSTVRELLAKGVDPEQVLAIDCQEDRVRAAIEHGIVALRGDATKEAILEDAVLGKANAVIVAAGRDDTNALILLTLRHLHRTIRIIVSAKSEENVKLFEQGGANAIISPATFAGYVLAAAVDQFHLPHYIQDLLTSGGYVNLVERPVRPDEVGKMAMDLGPDILLRVYRRESVVPLSELQEGKPLEAGDILVAVKSSLATSDKR